MVKIKIYKTFEEWKNYTNEECSKLCDSGDCFEECNKCDFCDGEKKAFESRQHEIDELKEIINKHETLTGVHFDYDGSYSGPDVYLENKNLKEENKVLRDALKYYSFDAYSIYNKMEDRMLMIDVDDCDFLTKDDYPEHIKRDCYIGGKLARETLSKLDAKK